VGSRHGQEGCLAAPLVVNYRNKMKKNVNLIYENLNLNEKCVRTLFLVIPIYVS
jgi:hypothetical protein